MDFNTIIAILTLITMLIGIAGGVMAMGRKDQQATDLVAKANAIEQNTEKIATALGEMKTALAVQATLHAALERRVSAIEENRGACRLPHDHEKG